MLNRMERMLIDLLCVILLCASCCALAEDVTEPEITSAFVDESKEIGEVDLAEVFKEEGEQTNTTLETGEEYESNASVVEINEKNFPDKYFKLFVEMCIDNGDGKLTKDEINKVYEIDVSSNIGFPSIENLKGIEYFTKLKKLNCADNNLTTLNISKCKELKELVCGWNKLTKLNLKKNTKLETLSCSNNKIKSLDVSKSKSLTILECNDNLLTKLTLGKHPKLETLKSHNNRIQTINIVNCPKIKKALNGRNIVEEGYFCWIDGSITFDMDTVIMSNGTRLFPPKGGVTITNRYFPDVGFREYLMRCIDNGKGYLTSKECKAIKEINTGDNHDSAYYRCADLTGIEYFSGLEILICSGDLLTALDLDKNSALKELNCSYNQISKLNVKNCSSLQKLICYKNPIHSFDVSMLPDVLYSLALSGNWEKHQDKYGIYNSISCSDGVNVIMFPIDTILYDKDRLIYPQ